MKLIAGIDEVGRGPLAGPVVAATVILPDTYLNPDIKDSKKLSSSKREELVSIIKRNSLAWSVVSVGHHRIEQFNILRASLLAMKLSLQRACNSGVIPDIILVDGNKKIVLPSNVSGIEQRAVVRGDALHVQISAASILAKVYRDSLMSILHERHPQYEFVRHAGYPTELHRNAIKQFGPSPVHRREFRGVKEFL